MSVRVPNEKGELEFKGNTYKTKGATLYILDDGEYKPLKRFYRTIKYLCCSENLLFVADDGKLIRKATNALS